MRDLVCVDEDHKHAHEADEGHQGGGTEGSVHVWDETPGGREQGKRTGEGEEHCCLLVHVWILPAIGCSYAP